MPRPRERVPRYCKHRASGQAIVTLSGRDYYLGPHGTKASHREYDRLIAEWLANGRRPLPTATDDGFTVVELIAAYKRFASGYYRQHGQVSREVAVILSACRPLRELYGREPVSEFGPLKLQAVRQAMIAAGWSRRNINKQIGRIVRMFGWGTAQQLVPVGIVQALREVKGLHKGRTEARETGPVRLVDDAVVDATLPHLPPVVADMVRFQRLTGCRPGEVCLLRPADIDMAGEVWIYRPREHKTLHRGQDRVIYIGPRAQAVLRPYLARGEACMIDLSEDLVTLSAAAREVPGRR